ncbi:MAG: hypothetical protein ABIJ18_00450 [archaeon]
MMRKGQMEILGFLVIVLLIIAGIIFYIMLMPDRDLVSTIQYSEQNLEVSNMLDVIMLQTVCDGVDGRDVIKACIDGSFICDGDACDVMSNSVKEIVETYGWEENEYMFYIDDELYTNECVGEIVPDDAILSGKKVKLQYCNF